MNSVTHVLVPVDFSPASKKALHYGLRVAQEFRAPLTLLHVLTQTIPSRYAGLIPTEDHVERRIESERELVRLVPPGDSDTIPVHPRAVWGDIAEEILAAIDQAGADLVVMGTHGRRGFKRWFLGSTTERILRSIPVPVVTLSHDEPVPPDAGARLDFRRILCPTDFSDSHEVALPLMIEWARRFQAELDVVHVVERARQSPAAPPFTEVELARERRSRIEQAEAALDEMISRPGMAGVACRRTVLEGHPAQAILDHAVTSGADLIAMTLHGMGFIERALLGATAERVVRGSLVPVLSVPRRFSAALPDAGSPAGDA